MSKGIVNFPSEVNFGNCKKESNGNPRIEIK
jgi:hypothetical protein